MKRISSFLTILGAILAFASCEKICDCGPDYPKLEVVNQVEQSSNPILGVSLLNYSFGDLNIEPGESRAFVLDQGMPGGLNDLQVTVSYMVNAAYARPYRVDVDFKEGETITLTLKGCEPWIRDCDGIYLEYNP